MLLDDAHVDSDMDVGSPTAVSAALLHNVSLCGDNFSADSNLTRPLGEWEQRQGGRDGRDGGREGGEEGRQGTEAGEGGRGRREARRLWMS